MHFIILKTGGRRGEKCIEKDCFTTLEFNERGFPTKKSKIQEQIDEKALPVQNAPQNANGAPLPTEGQPTKEEEK